MSLAKVFATYDWKQTGAVDAYRFCPMCGASLEPRQVSHRMRKACPTCGYIHFQNPAPTVSVLISENQRVLLGQRGREPEKGKWALPSGYIEFDEDFLTAAIREAQEETGLQVQIQAILDVHSAFLPPRYHFLTVILLAKPVGGQLSPDDDLLALEWFPLQGPFPEAAVQADIETIQNYARNPFDRIPLEPGGE